MQVTLDIPDRFALNTTPIEFAEQLKLHSALLLYHAGKISAGAACEFAGIDRYTFIVACKQHKVAAMNYDEVDLMHDMRLIEKGI